jgi:RND family efflux transporter MFP subunit
VFQRVAEPGESLGSGNPVLIVDETAKLLLKVGVTDRDLKRVKEGQTVTVTPEDGSAAFPARVNSVAASPSPEDGLYLVEITPTSARKLTAGVLMQVRFEGPQLQAVRIPLDALVHRQDRDFVFLLQGTNPAKAKLHPVEVGKGEGKSLLLRGGLKGGERIVAEGAYFLQDGQTVRIRE